MTAPASPPMDTSTRTRACAYCRTEMDRFFGAECPNCGWEMGLIPIAETKNSAGNVTTQFAAEPRVRYGRIALLMVLLTGIVLFFMGVGKSFGIVVLGLAVIALAIYVWVQTRFAQIMYGLTPGKKLLCRTVLVIGTVMAFCTLVGVIIGLTFDRR